MTKDIGVDANINRIRLAEQGSAPSSPASGYGYLYAKTDGLYYKGDNGTEIGPLAAGGGSITQAYVGRNSVGASLEVMTSRRVYAKKVTIANACWITSIDANIDWSNEYVNSFNAALFSDSAGTPDLLLSYNYNQNTSLVLDGVAGGGGGTARWFQLPMMAYVTAGDYWIAVSCNQGGGTGMSARLAYDATGSDRYYTSGGDWITDWGFYTPTTSGNNYSIRANTMR